MNTTEIKFRGKRVDNNEWVYGYFVKDPHGRCRIYYQPFDEATSNTYHVVKPETVGQYIGKIKTDQDIYINDLVQHGETIRIVSYRNGNTCLDRQNLKESILLSFSANPKKVGNVFDNPELLTSQSEKDLCDRCNGKPESTAIKLCYECEVDMRGL